MTKIGRLLAVGIVVSTVPFPLASQQSAVPLPELTVEVSMDRCPVEDSPEAHEALVSAAARVVDPSLYNGISAQIEGVVRNVRINEVGRTPVPPQPVRGIRGTTARSRALWLDGMREGVFAKPLSMSSLDGKFAQWEYAPLFADLGYYFFTRDFLQAHSLAFLDDDGEQIAFCARDREDTYVDGRIFLERGSIASVDWTYVTPEPEEGAGGRVEFSIADGDALPEVGVFWRQRPLGDYEEWAERYLEWTEGPLN